MSIHRFSRAIKIFWWEKYILLKADLEVFSAFPCVDCQKLLQVREGRLSSILIVNEQLPFGEEGPQTEPTWSPDYIHTCLVPWPAGWEEQSDGVLCFSPMRASSSYAQDGQQQLWKKAGMHSTGQASRPIFPPRRHGANNIFAATMGWS